ncbi:hypothetical protein [Pedobacter nyackensis]|uniref:hypothetical protein n=1 Tax=Pedobacter nyackensis TaxID=475255 RepID=UPI00292D47C4|nr:hypothetical protein [Pedobacter nyackensis]
MKTSSILILGAVLVILGSLITYNFKLKGMYDTKSYRNPYNGMVFTPLSGIEKLNVQSANAMNIRVLQGDKEGVWVGEKFKKDVKLDASGDVLNIDFLNVAIENQRRSLGPLVVVITKKMNSIMTAHTEMKPEYDHPWGQLVVEDYKLDKLDLQVSSDLTVNLDNIRINTLNATVGDQYPGRAILKVSYNTSVNTANFNVGTNGSLNLDGAKIIKTVSNVIDSSNVAVNLKDRQLLVK